MRSKCRATGESRRAGASVLFWKVEEARSRKPRRVCLSCTRVLYTPPGRRDALQCAQPQPQRRRSASHGWVPWSARLDFSLPDPPFPEATVCGALVPEATHLLASPTPSFPGVRTTLVLVGCAEAEAVPRFPRLLSFPPCTVFVACGRSSLACPKLGRVLLGQKWGPDLTRPPP